MARHKHKLTTCPNCDHALEPHYDYCPSCGQENHDIRVPIGHVGYEFIEGITHFDTKIWNTLKSYFTKPGQITKEFLQGKRARYVQPPRFYIFISVIFFFLLNMMSHKVSYEIKDDMGSSNRVRVINDGVKYEIPLNDVEFLLCADQRRGDSILIANENPLSNNYLKIKTRFRDSLKAKLLNVQNEDLNININFGENSDSTQSQKNVDSIKLKEKLEDSLEVVQQLLDINSLFLGFNCKDKVKEGLAMGQFKLNNKEKALLKKYNDHEIDSLIDAKVLAIKSKGTETMPKVFYKVFLKNEDDWSKLDFDGLFTKSIKSLSFIMFLFMPLIALITWIFFRKQKKYYVEHLVYSIHIHTFIFLVMVLYFIGNNYFPDIFSIYVFGYLLIAISFYIIKSVMVVFDNKWWVATFKFIIIGLIYVILLSIAVLGAFFMGALS